jgi:hypothetical protein
MKRAYNILFNNYFKGNIMNKELTIEEILSSTITFYITNRRVSNISTVVVKPDSPKEFTISYITADTKTTGGIPFKNYTISIYEGLTSPVGRTPIETFKNINASLEGATITLKSQSNMLSGQYIIGLSLGTNVEKTLCSYVKLISGTSGAKFNEEVSVNSITANASGFVFQIVSTPLTGIDPASNQDTIVVFDNINSNKQLGYGIPSLNPETNEYTTDITIMSLVDGGAYSIGYYCGDVLGACSSKEYINITNIV